MPSTHKIVAFGEVDLTVHPETVTPCDKTQSLSFGDLHGNALKFIWLLIKQGVMQLNSEGVTADSQYETLVDIYKKKKLTQADLAQFQQILESATFNKPGLLRIIGDEFCDRGTNDIFTVMLFKQFRQHDVPFEVMLSNHSVGFLQCFASSSAERNYNMLGPTQSLSLINLGKIIADDDIEVNSDDIEAFTREIYQPSIKALSYSVDYSEKPPLFTLIGHAPFGLEVVEGLAKHYHLTYDESSIEALCQTIDEINVCFQKSLTDGSMLQAFKQEEEECNRRAIIQGMFPIPPDLVFNRLMWNRRLWQAEPAFSPDPDLRLPKTLNGFQLAGIHGHDGPMPNPEGSNLINTDNDNGKRELNGELHIVTSHDTAGPYYDLSRYRSPVRGKINDYMHGGLKQVAALLKSQIAERYQHFPKTSFQQGFMMKLVFSHLHRLDPNYLNRLYLRKGADSIRSSGNGYDINPSKLLAVLKKEKPALFDLGVIEKDYDEKHPQGFNFSPKNPVKMAIESIIKQLEQYHGGKLFVRTKLSAITTLADQFKKGRVTAENFKNQLTDIFIDLEKSENNHYQHMWFFKSQRKRHSSFHPLLTNAQKIQKSLNHLLDTCYIEEDSSQANPTP